VNRNYPKILRNRKKQNRALAPTPEPGGSTPADAQSQ